MIHKVWSSTSSPSFSGWCLRNFPPGTFPIFPANTCLPSTDMPTEGGTSGWTLDRWIVWNHNKKISTHFYDYAHNHFSNYCISYSLQPGHKHPAILRKTHPDGLSHPGHPIVFVNTGDNRQDEYWRLFVEGDPYKEDETFWQSCESVVVSYALIKIASSYCSICTSLIQNGGPIKLKTFQIIENSVLICFFPFQYKYYLLMEFEEIVSKVLVCIKKNFITILLMLENVIFLIFLKRLIK